MAHHQNSGKHFFQQRGFPKCILDMIFLKAREFLQGKTCAFGVWRLVLHHDTKRDRQLLNETFAVRDLNAKPRTPNAKQIYQFIGQSR